MRVSDRIKKCTVFIGMAESRGFVPIATGFLIAKPIDGGQAFQYLVTAQHCIVSGKKLYVRINKTDGSAAVFEIPHDKWFYHPDVTRVIDVAVMPILLPADIYDIASINADEEVVTDRVITMHDIGIGDEVAFPGLFVHHSGQGRNIPIMRSGTLAAMADEPVITQSGPMRLYLAEARSIGGHSGSPVFVNMHAPRNFPSDKPRLLQLPGTAKPYYLLGLIRSHLRAKDSGEYATDDPKTEDLWVNSGIATVVPAHDILETINQPELEELRRQAMKELHDQSVDVPTSVVVVNETELVTNPDENPAHREDFTALVGAASKPKPRGDRT